MLEVARDRRYREDMVPPRGGRADVKITKLAGATLSGLLIAASLAFAVLDGPDRMSSLSVILGIAAVGAGVLVSDTSDDAAISSSFIVFVLAAAFLGPLSALIAGALSELGVSVRKRTPVSAVLLMNLPIVIVSAVAVSAGIRVIEQEPVNTAVSYVTIAGAAVVVYFLTFFLLVILRLLNRPEQPMIPLSIASATRHTRPRSRA